MATRDSHDPVGTSFEERCARAFLGLALGDAFGRPLEFLGVRAARTAPVDRRPGAFRWTDDTHMALYLAEAVLASPPGPLDADAFGTRVGERFSAWLDDPLTPTTAPGNTCLAGARAWRRTRDWRTSGVARSDGCGAVMRVAPLPMALDGEDLRRAAVVQARLTHGHPNAAAAAVAAVVLTRRLLDGAPLDGERVREAVAALDADGLDPEGAVRRALGDALALAGEDAPWLDEAAVHPGDGGWRSPSAVGLALAAALRWREDPALAVEKAARIGGDSDSVAALCGMFLGAAGAAFPAAWIAALPERERIASLARRLASRG